MCSAEFSLWRLVMRRYLIVAAVIGTLIATHRSAVACAQEKAGGPKRPAVIFLTDGSSTLAELQPLLRPGDGVIFLTDGSSTLVKLEPLLRSGDLVVVVDQSASMQPGSRLPDAVVRALELVIDQSASMQPKQGDVLAEYYKALAGAQKPKPGDTTTKPIKVTVTLRQPMLTLTLDRPT